MGPHFTPSQSPSQPQLSGPAPKNLRFYLIGLGIIGLFVVGLVVFVLLQAGSSKADSQTQKKADAIVTKLNDYTDKQQKLPASLADAGIKDVPATVTYKKLSEESYRFCVTYHNASGFDGVSSVEETVYGGMSSSGAQEFGFDDSSDDDLTYLYLPYNHKKGENCVKVSPYISSYPQDDGSGQTTDNSGTYPSGSAADPAESAAAAVKSDTACEVGGSYKTHYSGKVTDVTYPSDGVTVLTIQPDGDAPKGEQKLTLKKGGQNLFDGSCVSSVEQVFLSGDAVAVFLDNSTPGLPTTIVNYSI